MRVLLTIFFVASYAMAFCQKEDDIPARLSYNLTKAFDNDRDKVKAIFQWIAANISYNRPSARPYRLREDNLGFQFPEDTGAITPLTERVATKVLRDRRTHCEGYARLFQSLCDHAGITATIITGYARNGMASRFRSNHSWNAVWLDSAWHLVDVTWAAGHVTYSTSDFIQYYNDYYLFTPPSLFAQHHYPDDLRWTLLADPPALDEFRKAPYRQRSYGKYYITDYWPSKGVIEASIGDTLRFEIQTTAELRFRVVAPDTLWDAETFVPNAAWAFVTPQIDWSNRSGKATYEYVLTDERVEWIHLMYNQDAVLRYRLSLRKERPAGDLVNKPMPDTSSENTLSGSFPAQ